MRPIAGAVCALFVALVAGPADTRPAVLSAQAPAWPSCNITTTERVVAIGDVHGAYDEFLAILRAAGLVHPRNTNWAGGRAILVQTGDVLDRGGESRKVLDLLQRLERDAARAGGQVHPLLGNHEFMRMIGDWRYVSAGELSAFRRSDSEDIRQSVYEQAAARQERRAKEEKLPFNAAAYRAQFMKEIPLGFLEMRAAFDPAGSYGKWLRQRDVIVKVNGTLFLHGGISPDVAALGCAGINDTIRRELAALPLPPEKLADLLAVRESGPLWYRGLMQEPEGEFSPILSSILQRMDAKRIVVGHTPVLPGRVATRLGGRVVGIDSGMLNGEFYPKGVPSALELRGDRLTAIYLDRREVLN